MDSEKISVSEGGDSSASKFINPQLVIDQLEIDPQAIVADFGCGTGYFTFPLARKVRNGGKVYAMDVLAQKLEAIESETKILGLTNITTYRVNLEKIGGSKLQDNSVDWVFVVNMLFQNKNKEIILEEAKRILKDTGKIVVIEWGAKNNSSVGPENGYRISKEALVDVVQKAGLAIIKDLPISDFHYGLMLIK